MKTVFPTYEIAHLWAHQSQDSARNSGNTVWFRGNTIYSYGEHFPMACHVVNKRGLTAVFVTTCSHSVTTSGHLSGVRQSVSHLKTFHVPLSGRYRSNDFASPGDLQAHIESYRERITEKTIELARAKKNADYRTVELDSIITEANDFCTFFDLPDRFAPVAPETVAAALAADKEQRKVERRKKAEHQKALEAESKQDIADWLSGKPYSRIPSLVKQTYLRINGDEVETSRGARFPVEHAKRGLALIQAVVARGEEWRTNGHTCHLGHYRIDRIESNGTVHAGCHVVSYSEISRIAPALERAK